MQRTVSKGIVFIRIFAYSHLIRRLLLYSLKPLYFVIRAVLFLLLSLVYVASCRSQEAIVSAYSVNEGLSQSTITGLFQDNRGYLWVGSGHGLNQFNGYGFRSFLHTSNEHSISNDIVRGVYQDKDGVLWIATEGELNKYDPSTEKFSVFQEPLFTNNTIRVVAERGNWLYALRGAGGLIRFQDGRQGFESLYQDTLAKGFLVDSTGNNIIFSNRSGHILVSDLASNKTTSLIFEQLEGANITGIVELLEGEIGVCCSAGFFRIDLEQNTCSLFHPTTDNVYVSAACTDREGLIWLALQNRGIYVFDKSSNLINEYSSNFRPLGLPAFGSIVVQELLCDRDGNIWIGTDAIGLIQIRTRNLRFGNVMIPRKSDEESNPIVWAFCRDAQYNLWVGTNRGIYVFDSSYRLLDHIEGWNENAQDRIAVLIRKDDHTMLAFGQKDVLSFDCNTRKYSRHSIDIDPAEWKINSVVQSGEDIFWLGTNRGLMKFNLSNKSTELSMPFGITHLYKSTKDELFACIRNRGISKLQGSEWIEVLSFSKMEEMREVVMVRTMVEAAKSGFWLGTSSGLFLVNENFEVQRAYSIEDGLPDTYINAILRVDENVFWISTNKGLARFDNTLSTFQNYTKQDGLQSNEFNSGSAYKDETGEIYFGGIEGFNHFSDRSILKRSNDPDISIENLFLGSESAAQCFDNCVYTVSYSENGFTLDLCAMDFTNPDRNRYSYMLAGFDTAFYDAGTNRSVRYTGLPPGKYTFYARTSAGDAEWGVTRRLFEIDIVKPFWMRYWFITICIVLVIFLLGWTIVIWQKRKFRRQIAELRHQREIEAIRNTISGDIHDEIGAGLTRIALLSDSIAISGGELKDHSKLKSLSQVARSLSSSLKEVIWSTNPGYDTLNDLHVHLRSYSSDFLEDAGIDVVFEMDQLGTNKPLNPVKRRSIFMITKEALTNIVRHGEANKVKLKFQVKGQNFILEIEDNGKGFNIDKTQSSHGLSGMKRRAKQADFDIEIRSDIDKGTVVHVSGSLIT